ncbi:PcfJ-like protein [uncultured Caudovirales phage]|uniref:PcfJ-like protein n=1 Tax=uncultured Caudovirales phage TaxID=2100421 RepID=A0A6J5KNR3_9CAUD|nr:PcfJ-like protein [uncultured Caudovirales phage]
MADQDYTPSIFSVSPYSSSVAREMYPGQMGQDDQQDAARHMLAAGTMARKYGPTVADLAGKAHEYSTSSLRALMMMIGRGEMPPDYKLDMHNNALGIEMARRAKSQRELEDLVQQAAERSSKTQTEGRPWVNKAKGGEVSADELDQFVPPRYRSAGRRPEAYNDRAASADAPLALLRGVASGVLGAPGDIESLIRMLPGLSDQTVLPTSADVERRLPLRGVSQTPVGRAATEMGTIGGGFYTGPGAPLRAVAALPSAVSRAGRDFVMAAGQPAVNVVKPKGGNFLTGTVERVVEPMKTRVIGQDPANRLRDLDAAYAQNVEAGVAMDPAVFARERARLEPEVAMNRWLETKLGKYMRNEMATPEDPLRALAERGITHAEVAPLNTYLGDTMALRREAAGFPAEGLGQSEAAQRWEAAADYALHNLPAKNRLASQGLEAENPWLLKVPPETMTYGAYSDSGGALGFGHLVDELRNAVNPESGLPANLRLKYQDLEKVTVPQAVERVAKINDWRAAQKAEADMARAMGPATQVVKEYPEQGFKWVELRAPKETGRKISVEKPEMDLPPGMDQQQMRDAAMDMAFDEGLDEGTQAFDDFVQNLMTDFNRKKKVEMDESYKALEDALKYEGETMGHCVGGYCPDVVEGRSKIYSLRDKKGQPHVTIEVKPGVENPSITEGEFKGQRRFIVNNKGTGFRTIEKAQKYAQEISTPEIVQIKGKANRAPNAEYLPAVQDFIRSGNFGKVGDLQNAGLVDVQDPNALLRALGKVSPERNIDQAIDNFNTAIDSAPNAHRYMTLDELRDFLGGSTGPEGLAQGGQVRGYAVGGLVNQTVNQPINQANIYNSDAKQDPASSYKFADGGFAGSVPGYAAGGVVSGANFPTDDFDPARIDAIVGELHALNAG